MNNTNQQLYLELIKRVLTDTIYQRGTESEIISSHSFVNWATQLLKRFNLKLTIVNNYNQKTRILGTDIPKYAHTMIGLKRLENLQFCIEKIIEDRTPGDLIETGVWRGGACIFMRAVLKAYNIKNRSVWAADSFSGLPKPNINKYPQDKDIPFYQSDTLKVTLNEVKHNFRKYDLLDKQVKFLKGWFSDTLPTAPIEKLALIRIDGDMYESTWDALQYLYPKLSKSGFVIVDDFGDIPACRQAVVDYRKQEKISEKIIRIDNNGIYWKKK